MEQAKIDRINELARKSRTEEGLTPEEKAEQAALRQEYVAAIRASLTAQLDSTVIQYPDGTRKKLKRKRPLWFFNLTSRPFSAIIALVCTNQ